jgi:hypothetical protein
MRVALGVFGLSNENAREMLEYDNEKDNEAKIPDSFIPDDYYPFFSLFK